MERGGRGEGEGRERGWRGEGEGRERGGRGEGEGGRGREEGEGERKSKLVMIQRFTVRLTSWPFWNVSGWNTASNTRHFFLARNSNKLHTHLPMSLPTHH